MTHILVRGREKLWGRGCIGPQTSEIFSVPKKEELTLSTFYAFPATFFCKYLLTPVTAESWAFAQPLILATTPDKRNRHLKRIVTYSDRHYHGNVTDMTEITKEPLLTVTSICKEPSHTVTDTLETYHRP